MHRGGRAVGLTPETTHRRVFTYVAGVLVAAMTWFVIELIRATGPVADQAFAVSIGHVALTAVGTYALPAIIGCGFIACVVLVSRSVTWQGQYARVAPWLVGFFVVCRVGAQLLTPGAALMLTLLTIASGIAAFAVTVCLVGLLPHGQTLLAGGIAAGTAIATMTQTLLRTWDPLWQRGWLPSLLPCALGFVAIVCATMLRNTKPRAEVGIATRLWLLGPLFAVGTMTWMNVSFVTSQSTVSVPVAGAVLSLSSCLGILWVAVVEPLPGRGVRGVVVALVTGALATALYTDGVASLIAAGLTCMTVPILISWMCNPKPRQTQTSQKNHGRSGYRQVRAGATELGRVDVGCLDFGGAASACLSAPLRRSVAGRQLRPHYCWDHGVRRRGTHSVAV